MSTIIILIILYLLGVYMANELVKHIELRNNIKYRRIDVIKLILGSWYTCIILDNIINDWKDD